MPPCTPLTKEERKMNEILKDDLEMTELDLKLSDPSRSWNCKQKMRWVYPTWAPLQLTHSHVPVCAVSLYSSTLNATKG